MLRILGPLAPMLLALVATAQDAATVEVPDLATAEWTVDEVGVGVLLRTAHPRELFGAPQSLSVLEVELRAREGRLRFASPQPFARERTSDLADLRGALAAVNGGFFNTGNGVPSGLLKIDGATLSEQGDKVGVALGVERRERVRIEDCGPAGWPAAIHAMAARPRLLRDGRLARPGGFSPSDRRHPRTAAGTTRDGRLLLLSVDGRTDQAAGMTLVELARTMQALGCAEAMNLDGGGSTTMWVRGRGVINHPCDNRKFDRRGERSVANAVLIFAPAVVRLDEDRATRTPERAWQLREESGCLGGDFALATEQGAEARFEVALPAPGRYAIELRWPRTRGDARSLELRLDARRSVSADPRRTAHRWHEVTTEEFEGPAATLVLCSPTGSSFTIDALRLVEISPD